MCSWRDALMIGSILGCVFLTTSTASEIDQPDDAKKSYAGYKLLRTSKLDQPKLADALMLSLDGKHGVHFWTYPKVQQSSDILTSPHIYPHVKSLLEELGIQHDVVHEDIDRLIQEENEIAEAELPESRQAAAHRMDWRSYHRYQDIYDYCRYIATSSQQSPSGARVTLEQIGKTSEGRDIILMKISKGAGNKPAIWLDGGMHAREWISPATVTYILNLLVTNPEKSSEMLDNFDWYIVPVINVDGYEYTHTRDRFWRKTRSHTGSFLGCRGVDPNRNWGYMWGGAGTSANPCSDVYKGQRAFSEPETRAVANAILARRNQIKMYLTFHSYSQLILVPWGFGRRKPVDYNDLYSLGLKGKAALEATYQTRYKLGTAPDLLYAAAGGSDDWAKGSAGIKYSYTFELRDTGRFGFALPANQIIPTGIETFNGVRALALALRDTLKKQGPFTKDQPNPPDTLPARTPLLPLAGAVSTKDLQIEDQLINIPEKNSEPILPQ